MESVTQWINDITGLNPQFQSNLFTSIFIIFLFWLIRTIIIRIIWRKTEVVQQRYRWQKITTYVSVTLGILLVGRIWFEGIQSLATFLGLVTAGLAIALQDIVKSLAGWIFILWRKPFSLGDRIQVGNHAGDVIDVRVFKFTMLEIGNWVDADQSTGRMVHLPNSLVLTEVVANYAQGFEFIWNEIPVLLTFESNWKKGKEILRKIVSKHAEHLSETAEKRIKEASKRFMIFYKSTVKDSGVLLTLRYMIDPRRRRGSEEAIWEDILTEFAACNDIDFAYPTRRLYNNALEGKPEARAKVPEYFPKDS
jgi:small-conductance mechanosensitive channel